MKRRQRRPVLEINKQGGSQEYPQNKGKQVSNDYPEQNVPANPLANLLCHYNSDSDTEDPKKDVRKLDDQVNNFLKEIQLIAPTEPVSNVSVNPALSTNPNTQAAHPLNQQMPKWQECLDESSGYPYYWHIETNEVTWEMPSELRAWKNNAKMTTVVKPPPAQESHWVDFSSITYQQSHENIPEGMIPREVVARNRNRYIRHETVEKQETPVEQDAANTSDTMDDDSDDGRIEMITSYGSEESDSDTENNYSSNETPPVTTSESTSISSGSLKLKPMEPSPASAPVLLPQLPKNSQRSEEEYESKSTVEKCKVDASESKFADVKDAVRSSKYQTKLSHLVDGEIRENTSVSSKSSRITKEPSVSSLSEDNASSRDAVGKQSVESDLDFRVSLVPGYDEDTDNDDEGEAKEERKALFPIPQNEDASVLHKSLPTVLNKQSLLDETRVTDSNDSDSNTDASGKNNADEQEDDGITEKVETAEESKKVEENTQKPNKFLDNFHGRSKCFQRKKRIAFEVPSAKIKIPDDNEAPKTESEPQQSEANVSNDTEQQDAEPEKETQAQQPKESEEIAEDTVESIKSLAKSETSNIEAETNTQSEEQNTAKDEEEVNSLTHIVLEKLKFLSEGKPSVSPVQTMAIQLQTLFVAWEGGSLDKTYLRRWLTDTSHELERLEQDAAPPGWLCQWDRSHKRYYYQNATTGVTQWAYPDTGIAGGTEEMEICSTPPPAEQEEITTSEADGISKQSVSSKPKKSGEEDGETNENTVESHSTDIEAPPPPQISNPSPPPPPRIYAEDLKKDKRRRDKCTEKFDNKKKRLEEVAAITDIKSLESPPVPTTQTTTQTPLSPQPSVLSNIANTEPLPPGVDLPDVPYEIPATALKRIIYSTVQQQGNSLYDASTRDPRVPILGHPAALVQEHYLQYPAYHQHIHAPAALVLPHKHGVQPAIQLIPDYTPIYTNHKVIEKPPVKTAKESLVSALDSFYNDIARIEKSGPEQIAPQHNVVPPKPAVPVEETKLDTEQEPPATDVTMKEKKRKKARIGISKKHKEMSSMVAKWQKAQQNYENNA